MKILKTCMLGIIGLITILSMQGCFFLAGAAVGAGGLAYVSGVLTQSVDSSSEKVHKATLKALDKLDMVVLEDTTTDKEVTIKSAFDDAKTVTINIEALTERASEIRVRVGVFGDHDRSAMVMNTIENQL